MRLLPMININKTPCVVDVIGLRLKHLIKKVKIKMLCFSTWTSEVDSGAFCPDGSKSCVNARLPACQDRSILCLDKLPVSSGLVKKDVTENTTLNNFSLGAKFSYTCQTPGN